MKYKHVDDDFRRGVANNNLEAAEREHASTKLALDALHQLADGAKDEAAKEEYRQQANNTKKRLDQLEAQVKVWQGIVESIPGIAESELGKDGAKA